MDINVKLDNGAYLPQRAHKTDAGADIRTPIDVVVPANGSVIVGTGVHVQTPENHVTLVKSKSGLNLRYDITSEGVVDEGYDGEIMVKLYNHGHIDKSFKRGDKITQILVMPVAYPAFTQVDEISGGDRGDSGFGSTGD